MSDPNRMRKAENGQNNYKRVGAEKRSSEVIWNRRSRADVDKSGADKKVSRSGKEWLMRIGKGVSERKRI